MYFGAIISKSFLASRRWLESLAIINFLVAKSPRLARVISFSIKGRSSLALISVVFIFSRAIKLSAKEQSKAVLGVFFLPNFLLALWCRIPLKILINNRYFYVPFVEL